MNDETRDDVPEGRKANENGEINIGKTLRAARQAAAIDVNKICTDLRISPQALEALEQGNYHQLPGDPYIRALLGSVGRYLNLDPAALVQGYNQEIGAVEAAPSIQPYKDPTQTHSATHKQVFIGIFVLFVVLFLLFRKLNVNDTDASRVLPPLTGASDTLSPAAQDSLPETNSLAPDTGTVRISADAGEATGAGNSYAGKPAVAAPVNPGPGANSSLVTPPGGAPTAIDSSHLTLAIVKPLIDSVWVKVSRSGKEDFGTVLRLGKQMQVSHTDTIVVTISKRKSVEVTLSGKTVIPDYRRFKIYGNTLKGF